MATTNRANNAQTSKAVLTEVTVNVIESGKNPAKKTVTFTNKEPLTKQFAHFTDIQHLGCELLVVINGQSISAKIPAKSSLNRAERNFSMIDFFLNIAFTGTENRATVQKSWIAENLAKKFKVSALSFNAFKVAIGHVKGLYRDAVKKQRLETEILNADIVKGRKLMQSEMKGLVESHRKTLALPASTTA